MFRPSHKLIFVYLAGLFILWAGMAALELFGQRKLFYEEGREELYDYWMPRMCLEQGYLGHPEKFVGLVDVRDRKPIEINGGDVLLIYGLPYSRLSSSSSSAIAPTKLSATSPSSG